MKSILENQHYLTIFRFLINDRSKTVSVNFVQLLLILLLSIILLLFLLLLLSGLLLLLVTIPVIYFVFCFASIKAIDHI